MKNKTIELFSTLTEKKPEFNLVCVGTSMLRYIIHIDIITLSFQDHLKFITLLNSSLIDLNNTLYKNENDFYLPQGSLVFLTYTSIQLVLLAKNLGLKILITSRTSSFKCISSDLINDYDIYDIQLYNSVNISDKTKKIDPKSTL